MAKQDYVVTTAKKLHTVKLLITEFQDTSTVFRLTRVLTINILHNTKSAHLRWNRKPEIMLHKSVCCCPEHKLSFLSSSYFGSLVCGSILHILYRRSICYRKFLLRKIPGKKFDTKIYKNENMSHKTKISELPLHSDQPRSAESEAKLRGYELLLGKGHHTFVRRWTTVWSNGGMTISRRKPNNSGKKKNCSGVTSSATDLTWNHPEIESRSPR
jgi:hypothetical protein